MDAKKCDRCGNFYLSSDIEYPLINAGDTKRQATTIGNSFFAVDMCPSCWNEFAKWWENKECQEIR